GQVVELVLVVGVGGHGQDEVGSFRQAERDHPLLPPAEAEHVLHGLGVCGDAGVGNRLALGAGRHDHGPLPPVAGNAVGWFFELLPVGHVASAWSAAASSAAAMARPTDGSTDHDRSPILWGVLMTMEPSPRHRWTSQPVWPSFCIHGSVTS